MAMYSRHMLIQSSVNTVGRKAVQSGAKPAAPAEAGESKKDTVILTASTGVGTLAFGLGGAYVGFGLGMDYGMSAGVNAFGGHPAGQVAGAVLLGIPLAIAYGVMGAAAGTAVGGVVGGAAGFGVGHLITKNS